MEVRGSRNYVWWPPYITFLTFYWQKRAFRDKLAIGLSLLIYVCTVIYILYARTFGRLL